MRLTWAAAAAAFILVSLALPAAIYDEGLIVSGAQQILDGQLPYTGFFTGYPPGQFYTIAAVFRAFGSSLAAARVWDALWRLAIVAAAYRVARELAGKRPSPWPIAAVAVLCGSLEFLLYPMVVATLPCLGAIACALAWLRTGARRQILLSGLLLGVTALYRHDLAVCAGLPIVFLAAGKRGLPALAAGGLAVVAPAAAWFLARVPLADLRFAFVDFPAINAAARRVPLTGAPLALTVTVAIVVLAVFQARRSRSRALWLVVSSSALFLALAAQRLDEVHAFPAVILSLATLAAIEPPRAFPAMAMAVFGVLPLLSIGHLLWTIRAAPASGLERAGVVRVSPAQAEAVRFVQARVPAGERIFAGTTSHSRVHINDALFGFLAGRRPAARHGMWVPGITNTAPVQAEIVRALEAAPVRCVVLFDAPRSSEPNRSSADSGVTLLDDFLRSRFAEVARFGPYRVLWRDRV